LKKTKEAGEMSINHFWLWLQPQSLALVLQLLFFFFWFSTVFPQGFQPETNHCSRRVGPRRGKVLAQEILFKVQVAGLELRSTPSRAQYKHFETESPSNPANPLGLQLLSQCLLNSTHKFHGYSCTPNVY